MVGTNEGRFNEIGGVALDSQENIYIIDQANHRIQKFDAQGEFVRFFGGFGQGPGQFNLPVAIAIDGQNHLYVSDLENWRLQKLDPQGNVVMIINNSRARDIALDAAGNIYTVEAWTPLRKFDAAGNLLWQRGYREPDNPDDAYCLNSPSGIAIGPDGNLYVADTRHGRVKKFDTDGNVLAVYLLTDDAIMDVAFDNDGLMYNSQLYNGRISIYRFADNGEPVWEKNFPSGYYSNTITLDAENNLYITTFLDQMSKVSPNGNLLLTLGSNGSGPRELCMPMRMAKDAQGNVYLTDQLYRWFWWSYGGSELLGNHRIRKLDRDGNFLLTFGKNGGQPGEFLWQPQDVAVDSQGNIYVGSNNILSEDNWNAYGSIHKFDASGGFLSRFQATDDTLPVKGIGIDTSNNIYVSNHIRGLWHLIANKFTSSGESLGTMVLLPYQQDYYPQDMEVDGQGNIFVVDNVSVMKFDAFGNLLFKKFGSESGIGPIYPGGLDVDEVGNVWVADTHHHRIVCFNAIGNMLFTFGTQGFGPGEFQLPRDVAVVNGRIFVADTFNQRVQIFDLDNSPPVADAGENVNISSEQKEAAVIVGVASDPDNNLIQYRWLEGSTVLADSMPVGSDGSAPLDLSTLDLDLGEHQLTLEVNDGIMTASDGMILTIGNSAPHSAIVMGGGTYQAGEVVALRGQVSDYDGDNLTYQWKSRDEVYCSGEIGSLAEGDPVILPDCLVAGLYAGAHTITLEVSDGLNAPVSCDFAVQIVDSEAPVLAPAVNTSILWPPNHQWVDILIQTNAGDSSGLPVALSAVVESNEPEAGPADGDTAPDWKELMIDQESGVITLQLRAERAGKGTGRVYEVTVTATDTGGNASTALVQIIVPHDQRKK
jgi:sugar lactone lactonase YvrE